MEITDSKLKFVQGFKGYSSLRALNKQEIMCINCNRGNACQRNTIQTVHNRYIGLAVSNNRKISEAMGHRSGE